MKKFIFVCLCLCLTAACAQKKPPLAPTQVVNGKSIVMPPEFFVLPKMPAQTTQQSLPTE
ncbi:MAG: hypothetical protein J6V53_07515 [Alphaproteobacteria bacterium]|nr:hypothetical protein [Alphaproteobacteria bacterium]